MVEFHVGDIVEYTSSSKKKRGIVTGFGCTINHYLHPYFRDLPIGLYLNKDHVIVLFSDEVEEIVSSHLKLHKKSVYRYMHKFENKLPIAPLPRTKIWIQDEVEFLSACPYHLKDDDEIRYFVNYINFWDIIYGRSKKFYSVQACINGEQQFTFFASDNELKLMKRGNLWKYHYGKELKFENLEQEIDFWISIGKAIDVKLDNKDFYCCPYSDELWEKAIDMIKNKKAHVAQKTEGICPYLTVCRITDSTIAGKLRQKFLDKHCG